MPPAHWGENVATYTHSAVNQRANAHAERVSAANASLGVGGTATSVTCTALPDTSDTVQVYDGPDCIAQFRFWKGDTAKLNVAQSIGKGYREPRGLILKVHGDGGNTGAYSLAYV